MKEQSSTLETTNPKIVLPNKDLVGVKKLKPKKEVTKEESKITKTNRLENACFAI
jgi:hypothetical protein